MRAGLALGCSIRATSVFARKNYFYPDLPKGYQISQYDEPICEHGKLTLALGGEDASRILRIHIEEDAGKNIHARARHESLVDLNRAGVPLIEIVGEPDLASAQEALRVPQGAARGASCTSASTTATSRRARLRCDANVSVKPRGATKLGTRAELKNMNSFRFLRQAIDYEIARQSRGARERAAASRRRRAPTNPRRARRAPCAPRKRRTTTATSPSPTCRRCASTRRGSRASSAAARSCRRPGPSATSRLGWAQPKRRCSPTSASWRISSTWPCR